MAEEKPERPYPLRSLHDFLYELDREWSRFRTGSLISMIASASLLIFFVLRFLLLAIKQTNLIDMMFLGFVAAILVYSTYAMLDQYRFFNRWERRIGLLLHIEEELMEKKLGE